MIELKWTAEYVRDVAFEDRPEYHDWTDDGVQVKCGGWLVVGLRPERDPGNLATAEEKDAVVAETVREWIDDLGEAVKAYRRLQGRDLT